MTLQIEIPEETQAKLAAEAEARGVPVETYVCDLVQQTLLARSPAAHKQTPEGIREMIRLMSEGNEHLPELDFEKLTRESYYEGRS